MRDLRESTECDYGKIDEIGKFISVIIVEVVDWRKGKWRINYVREK